ncbi:MAG: hypothetical protein AAF600_04655 [Bacteroidota bacterium]
MTRWSQLRPLSKLDQLAETIMKTGFLLSENHHVIKSYLNHKGANFKVINRVPVSAEASAAEGGGKEFDILCRQINIEKTNYAFVSKSDLERGLRGDLWIGLVIFIDGDKPTKYLFPSTVWNEPNKLFTDTAIKHPEYGISINGETIHTLNEEFAFQKQIKKI